MRQIISAVLFLLVLAACSNLATPTSVPTLAPTAVPVSIATGASTPLAVPVTGTSDIFAELNPEGQAAKEWNGIPIMPGAIAGEGDEEGYVFKIKATPGQIQEYYQVELSKLGWRPFTQGDDESSIFIFTNETSETLAINIVTKGDEALVLLVK
jgi:hypothetical protein